MRLDSEENDSESQRRDFREKVAIALYKYNL